ncbi:G-type lectin S-receptor-like serine/threonine-protein kinase At1g11330 [Fagus crenata]
MIWSTNVSNSVGNSSAKLLDSGNLVLQENTPGTTKIIWESFQHPSNIFLPKMKIGTDARTGQKVGLTSWKSPSDPSNGSFFCDIQGLYLPQLYIWKDGSPYWRSGPWNNRVFIGVPNMTSEVLTGVDLQNDGEGTYISYYSFVNRSLSHYFLNTDGNLELRYWNDIQWDVYWSSLQTKCVGYDKCGAFGSCNPQSSPICSCLRGFEPKNTEEWNKGNWSSGCVRRKPLQCERVKTGGESGKFDGFLKLNKMKVPDFEVWPYDLYAPEDECRQQCLQSCSCIAYAYDAGTGCMSWNRSLIDTQELSRNGVDLYIRLAYSELDTKRDVIKIVTAAVIVGTVFIFICTYFLWRWMSKHKDNLNQVEVQEIPLFNFEMLAGATNNFHESNKLGQGGFGPVYRGKLLDEQEIAVKRLSRTSAQGLEEFMNEVVVISKLQHRNLVRLLGCCVEGEERMLIYEYMPNKSLDAFIFDPPKDELLDWRKRFNIIEGICRGLLYLHRDSRLRIIHRDLKASNILLDKELNPKISDFGTARIFHSNEDQANTRRVIGTYGYMSPEYAIEGQFSEKSDIFSFGVLLLEIVSGRRNTSFYYDEKSVSLLGLAWELWTAENIVALIDPMISEPCFEMEILRCIHVGLLCVQELAKDRPIAYVVVSMLKSEIVDLPRPNKPAFIERQIALDIESSQRNQKICSVDNVAITTVQRR